MRTLLGRAVWTPDLAAALRLQGVLPAGWIAVTRDGGSVVDALAVRLGRGDAVLERRADAERLTREFGALETDAHGSEVALTAATAEASAARGDLERARSAEAAASHERRRVEEIERTAGRELEASVREAEWLVAQLARQSTEGDRTRASLAALEASTAPGPCRRRRVRSGARGPGSLGAAGRGAPDPARPARGRRRVCRGHPARGGGEARARGGDRRDAGRAPGRRRA